LALRTERFTVGTGTGYEYTGLYAFLSSPPVHSEVRFTSTNPTVGLRYKPTDSIILRASYGTAFLPPNYNQLTPVLTPFPTTVVDPKLGGISYDTQSVAGGNPNLLPQKSKNWDLGLIIEPDSLKGLRFDLEWYRLEQNDRISSLPVQTIVDDVYAGVLPSGLVVRDPVSGRISLVNAYLLNLTRLVTKGFDLSFDYRTPASRFGTLDVFALGTVVEHYEQQTSFDSPLQDIVNQVAAQGPLKYRAHATLTWEYRHWTLGWTARYYGSYSQYAPPFTPSTAFSLAQGGSRVPGQTYHDLLVNYNFDRESDPNRQPPGSLLSGVTIQAGVKDVFNSVPPRDVFYVPHYYSPFGDPRLRAYWLALTKTF